MSNTVKTSTGYQFRVGLATGEHGRDPLRNDLFIDTSPHPKDYIVVTQADALRIAAAILDTVNNLHNAPYQKFIQPDGSFQ